MTTLCLKYPLFWQTHSSPIHSPTPAIPTCELQGTRLLSFPTWKVLAAHMFLPDILRHSVFLSFLIRRKMTSRQPPFTFPTSATHKQTELLATYMFLYKVEKTVPVTDDPSTSTIGCHYTEIPYRLVSWDFISRFYFAFSEKTEKILLAIAHVKMLDSAFPFRKQDNYFCTRKVSN